MIRELKTNCQGMNGHLLNDKGDTSFSF